MNLKSEGGLTLVEVVVIVLCVLAGLLVLTALPGAAPGAAMSANWMSVGTRGKDIYVAITGANTEREALGLPPIWPREPDPAADTNAADRALFSVTNSTDYFRVLYDEKNLGTPQWAPHVSGFDYGKLAGVGVPACPDGHVLRADNNMWTVAKNVRDDMSDLIPVLITRNIDASSLAAKVDELDFEEKTLRFDPGWPTPFGDKSFVMVRKSGAISKHRSKYVAWGFVYANQTFDTASTTDGAVAPPLKYLTPTREVTPGEQAYKEGAEIAYRLAGGRLGIARQGLRLRMTAMKKVGSFLLVVAMVFLAVFGMRYAIGAPDRRKYLTSGPVVGVWLCGYLSVACYFVGMAGERDACGLGFVLAALLAQAVGIGLARVFQRHNPVARRWQIGCLLVPLWLMFALVFLLIGAM
jgi:hypothetical protein